MFGAHGAVVHVGEAAPGANLPLLKSGFVLVISLPDMIVNALIYRKHLRV